MFSFGKSRHLILITKINVLKIFGDATKTYTRVYGSASAGLKKNTPPLISTIKPTGKKTVLGAVDLIFCPRGVPHTWRVTGSGKAKVDMSFLPAGLEYMFDELSSLPEGPPDMAKVAEICGRYGIQFI